MKERKPKPFDRSKLNPSVFAQCYDCGNTMLGIRDMRLRYLCVDHVQVRLEEVDLKLCRGP